MERRQRKQRVVKDSTCTLEGLTVLAEHEQATRKYFDGMPKDTLRCFENSTKASIRRKRLLLGLPVDEEKQPTITYFVKCWDKEKVLDEHQAKDYLNRGYNVYAKDDNNKTYSVSFVGLELTLNKED